jgi:hypothetical protein
MEKAKITTFSWLYQSPEKGVVSAVVAVLEQTIKTTIKIDQFFLLQ